MAVLPKVGPENAFFWTSGRDGRLRFVRCAACRDYLHPPAPRCPRCLGRELAPEPVSGVGEVLSFTFVAAEAGDQVVAWIGFPEQADLRMTARLSGVTPAQARIGMRVSVAFEAHGDVHLPVFAPLET